MSDLHGRLSALRALSDEALIRALDAAVDHFERLELDACADRLSQETGSSRDMIALGLRRTCAAHRAPALDRWLRESRREAGSESGAPRVLLYVLPGNVPGLALSSCLEALLARCPVVLKEPAGDRITPGAWRRSLAEADSLLGECVRTVYWKGGDVQGETDHLAGADLVVASGDAATMEAIRGRARVPVVAHGPKWSLGAVGPEWTEAPDGVIDELAREAALWEQRGCLSPVAFFVGGDVETFTRRLGLAMNAWEAHWPPALSPVEAGLRRDFQAYFVMRDRGTVYESDLVGWSNELLPFTPGGRCLAVHPLELLPEALARGAGRIQALGTACGASPPETPGVSRFPLASIQDPPAGWRADGRSVLAELLA